MCADTGPRREKGLELTQGVAVRGGARQLAVVEQFTVAGGSGVLVRERQHHQLLERHLAVRPAVGRTCEPDLGPLAAAIHRSGRELVREREQQAVHGCFAQCLLQVIECRAQAVRVQGRAPVRHHKVCGFVQQSEGEQVRGRGTAVAAARGVQGGREAMRRRGAREHGAARGGEQRLIEAAPVTCAA